MKNLNLLNRLLSYSHEKQSPQRFGRYAAMLIMLLTLGLGQMWATTVYFVNWNDWGGTISCHNWNGGSATTWPGTTMSDTGDTYEGHTIYSCETNSGNKNCVFTCGNDGCKTGDLTISDGNGKMYCNGSWITRTKDPEFNNGQYIYIHYGTSTWGTANAKFRYNWNYTTSSYCCNSNESGRVIGEDYAYAVTPNEYVRAVQILRMSSNYGSEWNNTGTVAVSSNTKNCIELTAAVSNNYTFSWSTYAPPVTSIALSDNVTPISGAGTVGDPYLVPAGTSVTVTAIPTNIDDPDITTSYDWDGGGYGATNTKTLNCSVGGNTYSTTVTCRNAISGKNSTTKSATVYYQAVSSPTIGLVVKRSSTEVSKVYSGETLTLVASPANAGPTPNIVYEYSTSSSFPGGSTTQIASTTSTSQSWTVPANTAQATLYVRARVTSSGYECTSSTSTLTAYGKKTIYVRDNNNWGPSNIKIHHWGDENATEWPGTKTGITAIGGQWISVVVYSCYDGFVLNKGTGSNEQDKTVDLLYTGSGCVSNNTYYTMSTNANSKQTLSSSTAPAKPSVFASAATSVTNTAATINGSISSNGNDAITNYGFYWGTSSTPGTKVSKGTDDKSGAISHNLTGLTAGTTYYYQAYATNGQGETKSTSVQSFVAPYSVTISTATGCSTITPGTGTQYIKVGDVITATAANGYEFSSWSLSSVTLSSPTTTDGVTRSTVTAASNGGTIQPVYTAKTYTGVTLDKNTGSSDGAYSVTYLDNKITVTTTPAKTGYHVDGYYAEAGTTTYIATAAGALQSGKSGYTDGSGRWNQAGGKKLYTKWAANTYTAENNIDGNSGTNGKYTATYDATSIAINTAPTRTGYNLTGFHAYGRGANSLANSSGTLTASQSENGNGNRALTDASSQWIYDGSDATIYADWSPKTYSISLDQEGGASGSTSVTMTYDASTHTAITNPSKTGYTFAGYWTEDNGTGSMVIATDGTLQANVSTYTGEGGIWKKDATCTLYAKWTANNYTVTLSCSGETGYGSSPSGVKESVSATYDSSMPTMGTAPTPAPGYKFMGYFLGQNGTGVQYYAADGSSLINWTTASNTTLYAYFRKTEISSLEHPAAVAKGDVVYVVVDPVFNQTGAQNYMDICWSFLYDTDTPVESGWEIESYTEEDTKPYQVRFTLTGISSGYYQIKAVLKSNGSSFDACDEGTELSTIKSNITIAGNSKVTIQYQDDSGNTIATSSSVEVARGDSIGIKAPSIIGYAFDEWVLGDVLSSSCRNAATCGLNKDSINIKAAYDGYLTAKYTKKQMIYFNNTLEWDTVYVYFYDNSNYWGGSNQGTGSDPEAHSSAYTGKHGGMTKIPGTNIYYFDLAANSVSTSLTNVAFTENEQNNELYFSNNNVIGRSDYSGTLSMYVPLAGVDPEVKNTTGYESNYYFKGYWMNYPESTGYTLKIYDNTGAGSLVKERAFEFPANKAMPMSVTVDLEGGNKTYGFKIYRADGTWFRNGGKMTNGHSGDEGQAAWKFGTEDGTNCGLTTTSAGNYTFTLSYNSDGNHQVGVHYPEGTGDFRVMYTDDVRIDNHDDSEGKSWLLSSVIPSNTEHDTISYFVRAEGSKHPKIKIQKCTVSEEAREEDRTVGWADQGTVINIPDSITRDSVYNFIFTKVDGNLVLEKIEPYTGNYYIRVDGAGSSNWDNFRAADHLMPYSDYSFHQSENPYSHYFTQWYKVEKVGGDVKVKNIKFVVANDYSVCISDTIVKDGVADAYVDANGYITRSANIRFMYNHKTNVATRRYVDGAQEYDSEFLMIIPGNSKIYAAAEGGDPLTQLTFSDKGNWIYEAEVYALPTAQYKLQSKFGATATGDASVDWDKKGEITQYFKGGPSSTATLIGGDPASVTRVKIRLLYDFKTNRVVAAYQPSGTISDNMEIHADIMFIREHQEESEQITFASGKKISEIENIYCGLKFNRYTLNNLNKEAPHGLLPSLLSRYERDIFYVSFPYDVRLSDVIGFGTYGQHWIVEYYDGAARAANGFWIDSDTYWKFVTPAMKDTFTLKAGTGYIVALDLDEMWYINETYHADIWNNTVEVELLFPGDVSSISDQAVTYTMPEHTCTINRGDGTSGDRRVKDSHWNVLGVPTFKTITGTDSEDGGGSGAIVFANTSWIKDNMKLKFIYDGNLADNSLTPKAVKGFEFKSMHAYVVQYCGNVTFSTSNVTPAAIVARSTYAEAPQDVDFRLELSKNGVMEDQTFISLSTSEDASAGFVFGEDLSKEFNTQRANIYTFIGTEWAAGNTLPMSNQTTVVPVGVKIATDGEYTFAIPEGTNGVGVVLIDNIAGARTNLGLMDYTVTLDQGQIDNRFLLEISPIQQTPTDVENVQSDNVQGTKVRKVMIDGLLYIVKDGKVYDAQGKRVQ